MPNTGLTAEKIEIVGTIRVNIHERNISIIGERILVNGREYVAYDPGAFFDYQPKGATNIKCDPENLDKLWAIPSSIFKS